MAVKEVAHKKAFLNGVRLYKWGQYDRALDELTRAMEISNSRRNKGVSPLLLSFYGAALSRAKNDMKTGEKYCRLALNRGQDFPVTYLNLSTVQELAGKTDQAVQTLRSGYRRHSDNIPLLESLQRLSPRKRALLPFLDRNHLFNKVSSILLFRTFRFAGRNLRHQ